MEHLISGATVEAAATAIANARGGRRGAPPVANVLDVLKTMRSPTLPEDGTLYDEVMDDARAALGAAFRAVPDPALCPVRVQSSLEAYVRGLPPGDFIRAVLSNDLNEAIARADDVNIHALPHIVAYVREHLPAVSWGSKAHVDRWLQLKAEQRKEEPERDAPPFASTRPTDKACVNCGRLTGWQGPDGKFYCWPGCDTAKDIAEGRAVYGGNGEIIQTEREG